MSISGKHRDRKVLGGSLSSVGRFLSALAIVFVVWLGLVGFLPFTLILLTLLAMLSYFTRTGVRIRFSLRTLFVFTTGIAMITAMAAWVPWWGFFGAGAGWLGHMGGVSTNQIVIGVIDKTTRSPIPNAEVVLTSIATKKGTTRQEKTTQQGKTNAAGAAKFSCRCYDVTKKSLLKTWTNYRTDGWSLQAKALGYFSVTNTLSNISVKGEGEGPLHFRIELEQGGEKRSVREEVSRK